jgi:hypothetical protein
VCRPTAAGSCSGERDDGMSHVNGRGSAESSREQPIRHRKTRRMIEQLAKTYLAGNEGAGEVTAVGERGDTQDCEIRIRRRRKALSPAWPATWSNGQQRRRPVLARDTCRVREDRQHADILPSA